MAAAIWDSASFAFERYVCPLHPVPTLVSSSLRMASFLSGAKKKFLVNGRVAPVDENHRESAATSSNNRQRLYRELGQKQQQRKGGI